MSASRPPLEPTAVAAVAGPRWSVSLLSEAGSTNAIAVDRAEPGLVVVADHQRAGRGRLDRVWETPPGVALTFSVTVDPGVADQDWPLLALAVGLAVSDAVRRSAGIDARLKWPNDVLVGEQKLAGILIERIQTDPPLAVIGIGINVAQTRAELPVPTATSLALAGGIVDRTELLGIVLEELSSALVRFSRDPGAVLGPYRERCATLGVAVEVHLPGEKLLTGMAADVDRYGRLVVDGHPVGAGDVVHVRRMT